MPDLSDEDLEAALTQAITAELEDGGADVPYSVIAERVAARVADALASRRDDEETSAYELGLWDGQETAIQSLDVATGGDGEYVASTIPGEGCPTPDHMHARIVERFRAARHAALEEAAQVIERLNRAGPYDAIAGATHIRALQSQARDGEEG